MKVLLDYTERKKYPECPNFVPTELLNENRASINHGQTLTRLDQRGGLGPEEIIANIEDIGLREAYDKYTIKEAIDIISKLSPKSI